MATNQDVEMQDSSATNTTTTATQDTEPWPYNDVEMTDFNPYQACHKVLEVVELLEQVLTHVPFFQLFRIQRVSTAFNDTIKKSPTLQLKMMLKAPLNSPPTPPPPGTIKGINFSSILRNTIFVPSIAIEKGFMDGFHAMHGYKGQMHENLKQGFLQFHRYREREFDLPVKNYDINLANREASWRKILVARAQLPPFRTRMHMDFRVLYGKDKNNRNGVGKKQQGHVTLGDVLDAVEKEYSEYWRWMANDGDVRQALRIADDYVDGKIGWLSFRRLDHQV